jgi:rhodanese-related sulfurtransferase/ABC-type nitrate/sulfonate/bicarbonate transport system substrate-binding protein
MTATKARLLGFAASMGLGLATLLPVAAQTPAPAVAPAPATLRAVVVLDSSDLSSDFLTLAVANTGLGKLAGTRAVVLPQRDLTDAMRSTRTGENDIIIAPPHVTASALIHGYELVASTGLSNKYVLVGRSDFKGVADLKGRRAYFPQQDSLRSYVARGLLAQEGITTRALKNVTYGQTSGAGLLTLAGGGADATVALESEWIEWSKGQKTPGQVLATSQPMPGGLGVVVKKSLPANVKAAVVQWVTSPDFVIPGVARLRPTSDAAPYEYVASLGIFTPAELTGVQRVTARTAFELAEKGAKLVDVRTEKEYATKHARGAVNLPYVEKSLKEIDYDAKKDQFAGLASLNKADAVVFFCNGAECWKSFKASKAARDAGYTRVYWLRGGMPEWVAQGLPTLP